MMALLIAASLAGVDPSVAINVCSQAQMAEPSSPEAFYQAFDAGARQHRLTQRQRLAVGQFCIDLTAARVDEEVTRLSRRLAKSNRR